MLISKSQDVYTCWVYRACSVDARTLKTDCKSMIHEHCDDAIHIYAEDKACLLARHKVTLGVPCYSKVPYLTSLTLRLPYILVP